VLQGLLDVIAADDNAPVKVLRLRIKDESANQAEGANLLQPMEGDDHPMKPAADDSAVGPRGCSPVQQWAPSAAGACFLGGGKGPAFVGC
jgi:hypothetical protein